MKNFALVMAPVAAIALSFAGVSAHAQSTGVGAGTSIGGSTGIGTGTTSGTTNTPGSAGVVVEFEVACEVSASCVSASCFSSECRSSRT